MFKTAARKIAHNTTVPGIPGLGGKQDLRALQDLITSEKAVLHSCVLQIAFKFIGILSGRMRQVTETQRGFRTSFRRIETMGAGRGR